MLTAAGCATASMASWLIDAIPTRMPSSRYWDPRLDVMIMIVFLKSTVLTLRIRDTTVIQYLQQDIEYIRMCLLDLIQQNDTE